MEFCNFTEIEQLFSGFHVKIILDCFRQIFQSSNTVEQRCYHEIHRLVRACQLVEKKLPKNLESTLYGTFALTQTISTIFSASFLGELKKFHSCTHIATIYWPLR